MLHKLQNHIAKVHEKKKSFYCGLCSKPFYIVRNLNRHLKTHEKDTNEKYECDKCLKSFSQTNFLKKHQNEVHDKVKAFECHVCNKRFGRNWALKVHKANVHNENKIINECDVCKKSLLTERALRMHKVSFHDTNGEKKL